MKITVYVGPPRVRDYPPEDPFPVQRFEFDGPERAVAEAFAAKASLEGYDVKTMIR